MVTHTLAETDDIALGRVSPSGSDIDGDALFAEGAEDADVMEDIRDACEHDESLVSPCMTHLHLGSSH